MNTVKPRTTRLLELLLTKKVAICAGALILLRVVSLIAKAVILRNAAQDVMHRLHKVSKSVDAILRKNDVNTKQATQVVDDLEKAVNSARDLEQANLKATGLPLLYGQLFEYDYWHKPKVN